MPSSFRYLNKPSAASRKLVVSSKSRRALPDGSARSSSMDLSAPSNFSFCLQRIQQLIVGRPHPSQQKRNPVYLAAPVLQTDTKLSSITSDSSHCRTTAATASCAKNLSAYSNSSAGKYARPQTRRAPTIAGSIRTVSIPARYAQGSQSRTPSSSISIHAKAFANKRVQTYALRHDIAPKNHCE